MIWRSLLLVLLTAIATPAQAVDPHLDWRTLTSAHFEVHYASPHRDNAERAIRIAERVHQRLSRALDWQPAERTHLVLSDETDFANGFATVVNINRSVLFMAPPTSVGGLEDFDNWLDLLITHEYVHVLHLDKAEGSASGLRDIFGRWILGFPNLFEPAWLIEGLATWYETDNERGIGRGQSTFFESMMRAEVQAGIKPVAQVNLPINTWPAGNTRYLYGVYFFLFIEERYGESAIQALVEEYSRNLIPFSMNSTFSRVFGKDVEAMWQAFSAWLQERFEPQIEALQAQGLVAGQRVSDAGYRTHHVHATDDAVYYIRAPGDEEETLMRLREGSTQALLEVRNATFDVRDDGDIIISQLEVCDEYAAYYDLYLYDDDTGDSQRLTECARYQRAVWSADGTHLYAVKHAAGLFELHRLDSEGVFERRLFVFDEGDIPGDFDVSPDGESLVFSLWRDDFGWNLYRLPVDGGALIALTQDNHVQASPQWSEDGNYIYYSADYTDSYDIYRLPVSGGEHQRMTRTLTGALQSSTVGNTLFYTAYASGGTHIEQLQQMDAIATFEPSRGERFEPYRYDAVDASESVYQPWPSLEPAWWFPTLILTEDVSRYGLSTAGNDALGVHNYFAGISYDSDNAVWHLDASYSWSNVFSIAIQRDNDLFKDGAGNKVRILQSDQLQAVYAIPNSGIQSSSTLLLAAGLETISDVEQFNGATSLGEFSDNFLALAWLYNDAERYPLSISLNGGRSIQMVIEDGDSLGSDLDGTVFTAAWQEYIGLGGEHVLALRALFGSGQGLTSRFELGGEDTGVSYDVFLNRSGTGLFGRRDYPLRGYEEGLPQLRGRNVQLYSAEWRIPGSRTETGIMVPPIGLMQWYTTLFAETGAAYDDEVDTFYSSVGVEFIADVVAGYFLPVTARIGVANGLDEGIGDTRAYLSFGTSF